MQRLARPRTTTTPGGSARTSRRSTTPPMLYPSTGVAHARPEIRLIDPTDFDSGAIEIHAGVVQNPRILSFQSRSPIFPPHEAVTAGPPGRRRAARRRGGANARRPARQDSRLVVDPPGCRAHRCTSGRFSSETVAEQVGPTHGWLEAAHWFGNSPVDPTSGRHGGPTIASLARGTPRRETPTRPQKISLGERCAASLSSAAGGRRPAWRRAPIVGEHRERNARHDRCDDDTATEQVRPDRR